MLDLQRLERGTFLCEVSIDQIAKTLFEDVDQLLCELCLDLDPLCRGTQRSKLIYNEVRGIVLGQRR